jgi:hypothetical protein
MAVSMARLKPETELGRATRRARKAEVDVQQARQRLRAAIRRARGEGMTLDAIASIVGVSRQRILQLLRD